MLENIYGPELNKILQEMEEVFPPFTPQPQEHMQVIMFRAGQRSAVEWLHHRLNNEE